VNSEPLGYAAHGRQCLEHQRPFVPLQVLSALSTYRPETVGQTTAPKSGRRVQVTDNLSSVFLRAAAI
jgi:hypothetical protein